VSNSKEELISRRIGRQWVWLGLTSTVHMAVVVAVLTVVVGGRVAPVGVAAPAAALVIGAPLAALWLERRDPVGHRPDRWLRRALFPVAAHACAAGLVAAVVVGGFRAALAVVGLAALELAGVALAGRALRHPLTPELGEMAFEVSRKIRSAHQADTPVWALQDELRLTDGEVVAVLRPGPTSAFGIAVRLADVEAVSARPGRPADNPWVQLGDGGWYVPAGGEVLEIRHRDDTLVVPVRDAAAFADVIRARIADRLGMSTSS
jgi:hypothetical protein